MLLNFILPEDSKVENVEEDDKFDEDFQDPKKETAAMGFHRTVGH